MFTIRYQKKIPPPYLLFLPPPQLFPESILLPPVNGVDAADCVRIKSGLLEHPSLLLEMLANLNGNFRQYS